MPRGMTTSCKTKNPESGCATHEKKYRLEWAIQRINFLSGATNTGQALKLALDRGFDGARGGDIPKVAVVVTDGQSQDEVSEQAQLLRDAHIMVYAIGVTNLVNVHQLHQLDFSSHFEAYEVRRKLIATLPEKLGL
ncbi:von Willebrand factor type A domain protein [Cooperia oncophora]